MQKKTASIFSCGLLLLFFLCLPVNVHSINVSFIRQIGSERGAGNGQFYEPTGVAVAPDKRLYVVDSVNNRIQIFSRDGEFIKSFGTKGKGDGQFSIPFGIAAGADGRVFVTDSKNSRVQVFDTDGGFLYSFGRGGGRDGELSYPLGIAVDEQERIFIADSGNGRIAVFTMDGLFLDNIGSKGRSPGQLYNPTGVALSIDGKIWVTDTGNNRVLVFDTHGKHLASIGSEGRERNNFSRPSGIAVEPSGRIIVADSENNRIHVLNSNGKFFGLFGSKGNGRAQFKGPQLAALSDNLCYVADTYNHRIQVFLLGKEEEPAEFQPFMQTYAEARASFHKNIPISAVDIAVGGKENLFALDKEAAKIIITDINGNVIGSFGGMGRKPGMFSAPSSLILDENENIYVSDTGNHRIQVFDNSGKYLFEFGGSGSGDGKLYDPQGIIYVKGRIWVSDTGNNRIQSFSKDGIYLGQFGKKGSEDGMFNQPTDIAINKRGEIYVADYGNSRVQLFSADGRFLRAIDRKGEGHGEFTGPRSIVIDTEDRVFVMESYKKNRIQVFDSLGRYLRKFGAAGRGRAETEKPSAISLITWADDIFLATADPGNKRIQMVSLMDIPAKAPEAVRMTVNDGGDSIQIIWTGARETFVKGYKIYSSSDPAKGFTAIAETTAPSFNLEYKKDSQDSTYGITAVAKGGLEGPMAIIYPLGYFLFTQKDYAGAIRELDKVIKIDPKNLDAYILMGKSLNALGKSGDAMNAIKSAIDLNKDDVTARLELGKIYMDNNLPDMAIAEFQAITAAAPKEALAYNLLGKTFLKKKMFGEAIDALSTAARLNPGDAFKQDLNLAYEAKRKMEQGKMAGPAIDIKSVTINKVFSSLYKFYNTTPIGEIKITNNSTEVFPKVKVSLKVLNYMDFSTDREVKDIKPGTAETVPLYASFNNKILEIVEDTPGQAAIELSYYVEQKEEKTTLTIPVTIYNRNALTWITPAMISAFVTPKDEPVNDFARGVMQRYPENPALLNKQLATAMLIFDALGAYGITYSPDPNNPYEKVSRDAGAVDSLRYPRETLKLKTGDCDDLSTLISALLENLGIETAFIGTPGHLHLMLKLDIDLQKADTISLNPEQYVIFDNQIWIPVESTALGSSFHEAWYKGSEIYYRWEKEKKVEITRVHDAWVIYQPATLPPATWSPALPSKDRIDAILAREISLQKTKKILGIIKPYQDMLEKNPQDLKARQQLGLIYAENDLHAEAMGEFNAIVAADPSNSDAYTNMGNIYLLTGNVDDALENYKKAEAITSEDAEIKVNLVITYYKKGMLKEAQAKFKEAIDIRPSIKYEKAFLDSLLFK